MEISIKSASQMVKVSRTTIYEKLKSGELSRSQNGGIETSELLRVFGSPSDRHTRQEEKEHIERIKNTLHTEQMRKQSLDTLNTEKEELYKLQIKSLDEQLQKAHEREHWQREHIEKLTDSLKLLEAPKTQKGFFKRLFGG